MRAVGIEEYRTKGGEKRYRACVKVKGAKRQSKSFRLKGDAVRWKQKTEAAIRERRYFPENQATRHTVKEVIDLYKKETFERRKCTKTPEHTLDWWEKRVGYLTLDMLTSSVIKEHWNSLSSAVSLHTGKPYSNRTLNSYMETFKAMLNWAYKEYDWMVRNPADKISMKPLSNERDRILTRDELQKLLAAAKQSDNEHLYLAILMSIVTGSRRGEVLGLKWENVNLSEGYIDFLGTKNGESYRKFLDPLTLKVLKKHATKYRFIGEYVFPAPKSEYEKPCRDLRKPFARALKKAGIKNFTWHDMRHCAQSYLNEIGASTMEASRMIGHKTLRSSYRYSSVANDRKQTLVNKLASSFLEEDLDEQDRSTGQ